MGLRRFVAADNSFFLPFSHGPADDSTHENQVLWLSESAYSFFPLLSKSEVQTGVEPVISCPAKRNDTVIDS